MLAFDVELMTVSLRNIYKKYILRNICTQSTFCMLKTGLKLDQKTEPKKGSKAVILVLTHSCVFKISNFITATSFKIKVF